jgi:glycosyltransferase involved in cell wall biosynthesis
MKEKSVSILGTRGIPARHGGFETFAERFALYLINNNWKVTVYCQENGTNDVYHSYWKGIELVHISIPQKEAIGTIVFDWKSTIHASKRCAPVLILGYNTAIFSLIYRIKGIKSIINMDGIEWRRKKWSFIEKIWLYLNEKAGTLLATHLIADHPEIKRHLSAFCHTRKITVIPYGADILNKSSTNEIILKQFNVAAGKYCLLIARPEPENSILEIISAYSAKIRNIPLVVLGKYNPKSNIYHKTVLESASNEVKFVGAIYNQEIVKTLRYFTCLYIHGHTVGGTNPSLVEALGACNPILAHDNIFNRWVAGRRAEFFKNQFECEEKLSRLLSDNDKLNIMKEDSKMKACNNFSWEKINADYEKLLCKTFYQ